MARGKKQPVVLARTVKVAVLTVCVIAGLMAGVSAEPATSTSTEFYSVGGRSPADIRRQLETRGPVGRDGRRFHASTRWRVEWGYRWIESGARCQLNNIEVDLKVNMLLPKLDANTRLDATAQTQWDRYWSALRRHEEQHQEIAADAARELKAELQSLVKWHPCSQLQDIVNARADQVLDKYEAIEAEFDRRTDHGAKDGVVLPW